MRVLMVASEAAPFAKTGGLADVVAALPRALARLGHAVDVVIPRFRGVPSGELLACQPQAGEAAPDWQLSAHLDGGIRTILVDAPEFFDRDHVYGPPGGDYPDNPARFALLSRAAIQWAAAASPAYDVIHAHDWQAGLVPVLLRHSAHPGLVRTPVVFTIHNLAYQGMADPAWLSRLGLSPDLMRADALEFWGRISLLKGGLVFSRLLTTVSPRYAAEIQTPEYGCGLDGVLRSRAADLVGILNGIDYDQWNPARDPYVPLPFDADHLDGKREAKRRLLEASGLRSDEAAIRRPLIGLVSRMVDQKGCDLLAGLADDLTALDAGFVVLGTGERRYEDFWRTLASRCPDRVSATIGFDEATAHRIEAGADLFLMPSRFEPCGLNQMYSQRYGTVPIVRATGGLADTVVNFDPATGAGTGFSFQEYSSQALLGTLRWALSVFEDRAAWRRIQVAGMRQDFSWERSARQYVSLYERAGSGR